MCDFSTEMTSCLERWGTTDESDPRILQFQDRFEGWLLNVPPKGHLVVIALLRHFRYYSHQEVNKTLIQLHKSLLQNNIAVEETIFTQLPSIESRVGSSIEYLLEYKNINGISKFVCYTDLNEINVDRLNNVKNIIIIDDCCGTGSKIYKFILENVNTFTGKVVYLLVIEFMKSAFTNIERVYKETGIKIIVLSGITTEMAFSEAMWGGDKDAASILFQEISKEIGINYDIMGFKDAEGLMAFYNDTPNDTLKLFWYENDKIKAPFPREATPDYAKQKRPTPSGLSDLKQQRKEANYHFILKRGS